MVVTHYRSKRKPSGGRFRHYRGKKKFEKGSHPTNTMIGKARKAVLVRAKFGSRKLKLIESDVVNVVDQKAKKIVKAKMKTVVDNKANKFFIRRNILTKGAVVDTEIGKVRITNRPGQDGVLNGVLVG